MLESIPVSKAVGRKTPLPVHHIAITYTFTLALMDNSTMLHAFGFGNQITYITTKLRSQVNPEAFFIKQPLMNPSWRNLATNVTGVIPNLKK